MPLPGEARQDLWIIRDIGKGIGLDWNYEHVSEVYDEMRGAMKSISGITWKRLNENSSVTYPCADENDPGQGVVFVEDFPTASGKARLVAIDGLGDTVAIDWLDKIPWLLRRKIRRSHRTRPAPSSRAGWRCGSACRPDHSQQ